MSTMKKTAVALLALTALTLLLPANLLAQSAPSVRELIPASAPVGARVIVSGRGLADANITVAFGSLSATIVQRSDRSIEVVVPSAATTGTVRVSLGATLIRELPFTVTTDPKYIVSTLAGGKQTQNEVFKHPNGAAVVLPEGTVAVADEQHHQIKLVTPAGVVSVLAGSGKSGLKDGKGIAADFKDPRNLTFDVQNRVLYVSDTGNSSIRRVALDGTVTTVAGTGKQGYKDGVGTVAQFRDPHGLTVASDGAIYVCDTKNNRIRKVLPDGTVTTFAGTGAKGDRVNDGALLSATFNEPKGIVADGLTLYVADTKNNTIRKIAGGQVTTVITFPRTGDDDDPEDGVDGNPNVLKRPSGIGIDEAGNLIVSDSENDFIRKIKLSTTPPTMITIAGTGKNGQVDGDGAIAQFKDPIGLSVAGAIYVADEDNDSVRRLCPEVRATGLFSATGTVTAGTEVRIFGTGFVPGSITVKIGNTIATDVTWISASELAVKLPTTVTGGSIAVTISSCGGTSAPVSFVVDNTAPTLAITNGGAPLVTGSLFKVPVTPVLTATDDTDPAPRVTATLNGPAFSSGTTVTADGVYTLVAYAEDAAGNRGATQTVVFTIDKTPPVVHVIERGVPFNGGLFNRPVEIDATIVDLTDTTTAATIDGATYPLKQAFGDQGTHTFSLKVTDALGFETSVGPITFTIDITGPALTVTSHTEGQIVTAKDITITGETDDAVSVKVNGVNTAIDAATKTYSIPFTLLEGVNTIVVTGVDAAGNPGTFTRKIVLDTRAPQLTIQAPAACTKSDSLELHGTVDDPHIDTVVVKLGDVTKDATLTGKNWTVTLALGLEGRKSILVEATDTVGHTATEQATLTFDRTLPAIEITESGAPFTATILNRKVTPFVRATDADANTTVTATLDGAAWTSGTEIAGETSHTLQVKAKDCAGNEFTRDHTFTLDFTAPRFLTFAPASGSKVTQAPATLSGTVDPDAVEVRVVNQGVTTAATNGAFTLPEPGFTDGVNELSLELLDRAGNVGRGSYTIGVKTTKPLVEIIEGGAAMIDGTLYARSVKPEIRVFETNVTATATLDTAPFTSGTEVTTAGPHTIVATATDAAFGQSTTITRHFTIDRSGPQVAIVSPANGAAFDVDRTDVRVTADDAVSVSVNGVTATKQTDGTWIAANVALDFGETLIAAIGRDAAGNSGNANITVTRGGAGPALVLTFPPDNYVTNRPKLDVSGRVLRQGSTVAVTVPPAAATSVVTDPAGAFRLSGATLTEGEWVITATATEGGKSTSVQAHVTADFTPPVVRILESGAVFEDGAGFGTQAVISGDAQDKNQAIAFSMTIDGNAVTSPITITAVGGHTAILTARDAAGNESRLERTFSIGTSAVGGCRLEAFDPPDHAIIAQQKVELIGRSGGAAGVKVNGVAAKMSNGSFCASVELPEEGPNTVTIACTNADGTVLGDPVTITLVRVTNEPSVTITTPVEDYVTHDATIIVTGTLGDGAVSVDVNGKPATINGSNWTLSDVRLTDGVNVLIARAKNTGGRMAIASRRVTFIADAPAISISSPVPGFVSGVSTTDISGTYSNVDPTSLAIPGFATAIDATAWSDTTGKFVAHNVPLQSGDNTVAVTGRDRTGRLARAEVAVRYLSTSPVVTITSPADGDYFPASQGETFRVSGTFRGDEGSSVDVNGVTATVDGTAKTFFADVPFSTLPGGMTPVVARIAQPSGGDGAFDSLRVFKLSDAPKVLETFPSASAFEVDPGVVVLALFSAPMERQSTIAAFRLETASGTPVNGKALLDKDVLTFAAATTLTPGERYTIKIATTAKDLAGQPLAAAVDSSFIVATSAPAGAPTLTTASGRICDQLVDVQGTSIPGARVRLDYGQIYFTTTASATGAFSYKVPLSGQAGYHVIRVRTVGADGTLSAAAELKLNLDCTGPRVLRASYDRNVNQLTIVFSTDIKPESLTTGAAGSIQLVLPDNRVVGGAITASAANVTVVPAENLGAATFTLKVTRDVEDKQGRKLELVHTQLFAIGDDGEQLQPGEGFISGEVYDATTGRPLAGADISIEVPTAAFSRRVGTLSTATTQAVTKTTDARGRYATALPEGAHTIRASANGYTSVWRQIIVPAGAGVIPIDIRLTRRGDTKTAATGALSLVHGGTSAVTRRAELTIPAGAVTSGVSVTLTSTGAQSLAGLLPLGWSPLASAEIVSTATTLGASTLAFDVPQADITAAAQTLTAVQYDESRDEWRVVVPVVNVTNGKASFDAATPGAYALVYADRRSGLTTPAQSSAGAPLVGVADPCADGTCPAMAAKSFPLSPDVVLPTGSTVATLKIEGASAHIFPSGTAVQAYIDEELRLADGGRELPTPFATDLLLYRDLAGNEGIGVFNLAPSPRAAEVFLEVGFDHIRILPYPGRLDRGTLIGPEGGRVPADEKVSVEIPTGATQDALRATATSIVDPTSLGPIAGYTILGGFELSLERANAPAPADIDGDGILDPVAGIELSRPARATFSVDASKLPAGTPPQLILAELLETTPFNNRIFRLAAEMTSLDGGRWTTKAIDRDVLPVDGVIREGRYALLAANAPIAFARGVVKFGNGVAARDARVSTAGLGVADLSRVSGIFNVPVAATPAAPFTLVPRTLATGDGSTYTHTSAPAANAVVNVGDLTIVALPPHVSATIPANNATNVSLTTTVEATIAPGLDPASVDASSITVIDTTNGSTVTGTAAANGALGVRWTLPAGESLQQGRRYVAAVASTVRGTNGTPLGQAYTFSFTTASVVTNEDAHPEKIRITIPDANGVSHVIGTAGALKTGWLAIPVRRDHDFLTRYSAEAGDDGSFSITIGTNPRDQVTIADMIDLRVLNNNGALIAIIPLTPFVSEDGKSFVAPANTAVTFNSVDGYSLDVPAGAFDVATLISMKPTAPTAFAGVPRLSEEFIFAGTVDLQFEGRAHVPLQLTIPVTPGTDTSREAFLALLGQSLRGPRIMAVDTLTLVNGKFTTRPQTASGAKNIRTNDIYRGNDAKDLLQKTIEAGQYAAATMHPDRGTLAWSFFNTGATVLELVQDTLWSMYVGAHYVAESKGVVAFPVPAGTRFVVTAYDPATSLKAYEETYNGIPVGPPGTGTVIAAPETDFNGPHPVFATPFRIETATAPPVGVTLKAIKDITFDLTDTGELTINGTLTADIQVTALDVRTGERRGRASLPLTLPNSKPGDEIILIIDEKDVDPAATVSLVFNEPIDVGGAASDEAIDTFLKTIIKLDRANNPGDTGTDLLKNALLRLDSSGRRVTILLPSLLEAGVKFRLTIEKDVEDRSGNGLVLGQAGEKSASGSGVTPIGPTPTPIEMWFKTRGPKGTFAEFDIRQDASTQMGSVREIAQYDNLLFVAAVDGGVLAYDVSDPAALSSTSTPAPTPISYSTGAVTEYWSVFVDHHGRVFSTGMANMFGAIRTWRVEDFVQAKTGALSGCPPHLVCKQMGGAITSQNPGTAYGVGLPSAVVSDDRVEGIPRKAKFVVGDAQPEDMDWDAFSSAYCGGAAADAGDGYHQKCNASVPPAGAKYRLQRITVENLTLGLRWSEDAIGTNAATMTNVLAAPGDRMRITRNLSTYAVISILGYGIAVYDINAIESNEVTEASSIPVAKEQVALRANAEDAPLPSGPQYVGTLAYSPESHILASGGSAVKVYALDTRKGVVELRATPPEGINLSGKLILTGGMSPRFDALKQALINSGISNPIVRFSTGALYHNPDRNKDYLLIAALDYGLIAVEVGSVPLTDDSFADAVKIPDAAWAVRVIDKTNMAAVVDGTGRVSIVDLSRIDERSLASGATLFPTIANALSTNSQDPRILWKSEDPIAIGNIAPVVDPDTGILIGADLLGKRVRLASVFDPKVRFVANVGDASGGNALKDVSSIVPLGIDPPTGIVKCDLAKDPDCRGSLGVFRVETRLPGSMTETLTAGVEIAVESERVPGVDAPQTPDPYPVAHLRFKKRDGNVDSRSTSNFKLNRLLDFPSIPELRYQKGYNRFASDWIVAIADPRAAKDYNWGSTSDAEKENLGCFSCVRPKYIKDDTDAKELYTAGRFIAVRPESISASNPYAFLSENERFRIRAGTTMADIVRPSNVLIAATNAPVASGSLQETIYLHSGEVEHHAIDLDAGGRAGWNVIIDRTYRSRSLGFTPVGLSWDSGIFKRLRALPNGDVEYRDGSGEVFLYVFSGGQYVTPKGYFARLTKASSGWVLTDQKLRHTYFDDYGRVIREGDQFYTPDGKGNQIQYIYDSLGRLDAIIDANDRANRVRYYEGNIPKEGFLKEIEDWRTPSRKLKYDFDAQARLTKVNLPDFRALLGTLTQPERRYAYDTAGGNYSDKIELDTNLTSIIEPDRAPFNGPPRIAFKYTGPRDYVHTETWATGEEATFDFTPGATPSAKATDVLGQVRNYTFKMPPVPPTGKKHDWYFQDRVHTEKIEETEVDVYKDASFGVLPSTIVAGPAQVEPKTRTFRFGYDDDGLTQTATLDGVSTTEYQYTSAGPNLGKLLMCMAVGAGSSPCTSGATVKTTYEYDGTYLKSTTANGQTIQTPQAHRGTPEVAATNNSVTTTTKYDLNTGLPTDITTSGGTAGDPTNTHVVVDYPTTTPSLLFKRGLPDATHTGSNALTTTYTYVSQDNDRVDDGRNTTDTTYDEWHRPIKVKVTNNAGDPLTIEESFVYDPNGRLLEQRHRQTTPSGDQTVTTTYDYDAMGRVKSVAKDNVDVNGASSTITETTDYSQFGNRTIVAHPAGGSDVTTTLDKLGRTKETKLSYEPGKFITTVTAYDLAGNGAYISDQKIATAYAFDPAGRMTDALNLDGSKRKIDYDGWNRVTEMKLLGDTGSEYYKKTTTFAPAGKVQKVTETSTGLTRDLSQQWDAAGRSVRFAATASGSTDGGRATFLKFDDADRLNTSDTGQGTLASMTEVFDRTIRTNYGTTVLPTNVERRETKAATPGSYQIVREYDTLGNAKLVTIQALEWKGQFDQNGKVLQSSMPGRPTSEFEYDARGRLISETLPDGSVRHYQHNETGAKVIHLDEESEKTNANTDFLGRKTIVTYPDKTTEVNVYDGPRLLAVKNRQDLWQSFEYNAKGQLVVVYASPTPAPGLPMVDQLTYDDAGRMASWRTKDALIEYSEYTIDNLPKTTKQTRYKDSSGFTTADVLDSYTVGHDFNGYGELTKLTLPGSPGGAWTRNLDMKYDAMGNLVELKRDGEVLLTGDYRNRKRPNSRTVAIKPEGCSTASCLKQLVRTYSYKPETSQLDGMIATLGSLEIAGSKVKYDDTLQVTEEELKGVSGGTRYSRYSYDDRGRLFGSVSAVSDNTLPPAGTTPGIASSAAPGVAQDLMSPADFRQGQDRTPAFDATTRQNLMANGIDPDTIDPPGATAEPMIGHKIDTFTRGPTAEDFKWTKPDGTGVGDVRTEDGRFRYGYDEKRHLLWVAEKPLSTASPIRRVLYSYDANDRLIGRTAQYASTPTITTPVEALTWKTEDRATIIAADGVPPELTFVWDPVTDRLLSIFKAGASASSVSPDGNLLRQFIHGDLGLDDPIEITTPDLTGVIPPGGSAPVVHVYPVYDEAGNGTLQVVLNGNGEIVSRNISTDPYGGEEFELAGAAMDRIEVTAKKNAAGNLDGVTIGMRATESLVSATIATGARLAIVKPNGTVSALSPVSAGAVAGDSFRVEWKLTAAQWASFVSDGAAAGGTSLSIAATDTLRAGAWAADVPVLPVPAWTTATLPVFSSNGIPVEVREPLSTLTSWINTIPANSEATTTPYEVTGLGTLGTGGGNGEFDLLMAASFHAQPFVDPFTGKNYVRARWYDPETGSFLTPDLMGYRDSSNLYAFAAGDPINRRDPTGRWDWDPAAIGHKIKEGAAWVKQQVNDATVTPATGNKVVDTLTEFAGAALATQVNTTVDLASGLVGGLFTIGEGTGTAIGNYDSKHKVKSVAKIALHGTLDAVAVVGYGTGLYGIAETGLKTAGVAVAEKLVAEETTALVTEEASALAELSEVTETGAAIETAAETTAESTIPAVEAAPEKLYRTMSQEHYEQLVETGNVPATGETFTSPSLEYASKYDGVTVEFGLKEGTIDQLMEIGVRNKGLAGAYESLPAVESVESWTATNAFFKLEKGVVNIGLGKGTALEIFNDAIVEFLMLPK